MPTKKKTLSVYECFGLSRNGKHNMPLYFCSVFMEFGGHLQGNATQLHVAVV